MLSYSEAKEKKEIKRKKNELHGKEILSSSFVSKHGDLFLYDDLLWQRCIAFNFVHIECLWLITAQIGRKAWLRVMTYTLIIDESSLLYWEHDMRDLIVPLILMIWFAQIIRTRNFQRSRRNTLNTSINVLRILNLRQYTYPQRTMNIRIANWSWTQRNVNAIQCKFRTLCNFDKQTFTIRMDDIYSETWNTRIGSEKPWRNRPDSLKSGETYNIQHA